MGKSKFSPFKGLHNKGTSRGGLQQRSKYIDHSLEFVEWVHQLGFGKTRLGRLLNAIANRWPVKLLALIAFFSMALAFLLFFDFDFTYSIHVGERAVRDIKSPLSFEVVDEAATEEKRKQAENAVQVIFDYDRNSFEELDARLYSAFRKMRDEFLLVKWSRDELERELQIRDFFKHKGEFEKTVTRAISDQMFEWLVVSRFNPRQRDILVEILRRWSQFRVVDGLERLVPAGQKEILLREVARGGRGHEQFVNVRDLRDLNRFDDFPVDRIPSLANQSLADQRMLLLLAHELMTANVTLNKQDTESRREKAREGVLPVVISIKKGQVIIPEGTVAQPVHVMLVHEIENQRSNRSRNLIAFVSAVMFMVLLLVCFSYLRRFTLNRVTVQAQDVVIMGVITLLVVLITKGFLFLTNLAANFAFGDQLPDSALLFAAPVAAAPMLVGLLITSGEVVWIFTLFLSIVLGLMVEIKFSFMAVSMVGGIAAARGVFGCKQRNDLHWAGVRTGLVNAAMISLMITINHFGEEAFLRHLGVSVFCGLFSGVLSSAVALSVIPLLESLFNVTTDVKLLELSNLNHPLLKEMVVKAPGTYHHSLVVGSMVESAAEEIGANPLLARVMSYYHDIGKTEHAGYFIENQKPGHNPHDHLSPHMSKTILIAHVKDGVELGLQYKLGKPIIDGIVQHHGTTLIAFFYNRAMESQNEAIDAVQEDEFRYPGPKPQFREAALIMLADSIEAASRSLDEPTPMRLQNIVRNIIQRKFMDGQLDECNLTLKDLTTIEEAFTRVLLGIYHQRIDYPRQAGGGAGEAPQSGGGAVKMPNKRGTVTA